MKIHYRFPTKRTLLIDDHWDIPIQNGILRAIEIDGEINSFEVTLTNQPTSYALQLAKAQDGIMEITVDTDPFLDAIQNQLRSAMSFLHCYFSIDLRIDEYEIRYEAETPEEEKEIPIPSIQTEEYEPPLLLPFNMLTRAIMAAEDSNGPQFEATLASSARASLSERQYIDSFRYSFLLIESIYGGGQFKSAALKNTLRGNHEFRKIVRKSLLNRIKPKTQKKSDTEQILQNNPDIDDIIDHIVEKRGFYFHGNIKRTNSWKPNDQSDAESLALLTTGIAQLISHEAANPMFEEKYSRRHFEDAKIAGAIIVFKVDFKYRNPEEEFSREHALEMSIPGTKPTPQNSIYILEKFIEHIQNSLPGSGLEEATCRIKNTSQIIFEVKFHV
ncbi:TPA: hypothetical protein NJH39_004397 [Pseudomonas aeruginosa]|nr:hypothetical protein [Pseudomonas aeruginosa]